MQWTMAQVVRVLPERLKRSSQILAFDLAQPWMLPPAQTLLSSKQKMTTSRSSCWDFSPFLEPSLTMSQSSSLENVVWTQLNVGQVVSIHGMASPPVSLLWHHQLVQQRGSGYSCASVTDKGPAVVAAFLPHNKWKMALFLHPSSGPCLSPCKPVLVL